jgi:translation initiation factor 1 (eIF-1/SUI1)
VGFAAEADKKVRVIKLHRGGKKLICSIIGLEKYGCDLADVARKMSKKFGTGAAAMQIEYKELHCEGI